MSKDISYFIPSYGTVTDSWEAVVLLLDSTKKADPGFHLTDSYVEAYPLNCEMLFHLVSGKADLPDPLGAVTVYCEPEEADKAEYYGYDPSTDD